MRSSLLVFWDKKTTYSIRSDKTYAGNERVIIFADMEIRIRDSASSRFRR